ncbi:hypothetical protein THAR02_10310 [Trichoderma harzianum]|uniref:ADF-H domain-containing protein n=1 Tax=Trichoderma harzianum TaxID=5544 RepID=A0A0F9ZAJ2_TRIHA|nr:hypothetical protein THAR02_10310 [Trichoderma harzianum]
MSLNGLDDPKIVEAHEAGVAEPGGWFLLKYSSRDEVELLDKGNGGIVEIRNAIAGFEEESPLYGFLRYRRRNVIVKYLPEDCSRLIQARVAVHFNAVCERFSPYDTIFEISTAAELRDTKLSAACSLHAASGSTASSTSSRRRRLVEIAEEEEEDQRSSKRQSVLESDDGRPRTPGGQSTAGDEVKLNSELASSPEHSKFAGSTTSEVPKFLGIPDAPPSPTRSVDTTDSYNYYLTSKPKVKLAARPAADGAIRPQASGNFRPVSSLPAGYRFGKGQKKGKGKDGDSASLIHEEIPEMEPPADTTPAAAPEDSLGITGYASRPTTSTGSAADTLSVHTLSVPAAPTKPTITPEKARLMKAMKLREKKKKQQEQQKQKQKQKQSGVDTETPGPEDENTSTITEGTESAVDIPGPEDKNTITDLEYPVDAAIESHDNDDDDGPDGEEANAREDEEKQGAEDGTTASISQADSGVVLDSLSSSVQIDEVPEGTLTSSVQIDQLSEGTTLTSFVQVDQVSEGTRSDSPAVTSSERDEETAASSLSDSTDETVHAAKNPDEVDAVTSGDEEAQKTAPSASEDEGRVAEENASGSLLPAAVITAAADSSSSSSSAADASSSLKEDESTATIQTRETEIETETETGGSSAAAMESNEEIAAGAANKGSAKAETEKEKKGIAVPISKLSANIPTSGAPPAASLSGMGSGAGEIPPVLAHAPAGPGPGATPGDVAQATETEDKGELEAEVASPPSSIPVPILLDSQTTAAMEEQADLHLVQQTSPSDEAIPTSTPSDTAAPDEPEPQSRSKRAAGNLTPIRTDLIHGDDNDDAAAALLVQEKTQTQATQDEDDALKDTDTDTDTDNKPMVATKSPLTPVFPSAPIANGPLGARAPQTQAHTVRTVSNPVRGNFIAPTDVTQSTARSLSSGAAFLHKVTQQQSASLATMKPNVGSSISQRIKALEKLSATSGDQSRPVSRERPSSTFFAVQKRDTSRPPSVVDRTKSLKGRAASPTPSHQDDALFEGRVRLQRSGSVVSRVSMFEPLASASSPPSGLAPGTQSRGRPESVAITTKIIRDPSLQQSLSGYELPRDASDYGYQSPTDHHHHRGIDDGSSERRSRSRERGGEDDMGRRSSLNAVKGFFKDPRKTVTVSTNMRHAIVSRTTTQSPSTASHRLSMSSRRSITFDRDISSVTEDSFSGDDKSSEKKTSRAGRFMRKLSSFSSGIKSSKTNKAPSADESRNNASVNRQQQQQQPSAAPPAATSAGEASIVSDLGDVNVQFPDSLLWKRRNLVLDSAGNIILSALPAQSSRTAVGTKTYHMSKFRQPEVPDVDAQELPNSVVLNFLDGMGIQLACEDRTGQMNVLHVLQAAHANHSR